MRVEADATPLPGNKQNASEFRLAHSSEGCPRPDRLTSLTPPRSPFSVSHIRALASVSPPFWCISSLDFGGGAGGSRDDPWRTQFPHTHPSPQHPNHPVYEAHVVPQGTYYTRAKVMVYYKHRSDVASRRWRGCVFTLRACEIKTNKGTEGTGGCISNLGS